MIFIHIIIPILVGAYLYYILVYKKKTEKFTNTSEEQTEELKKLKKIIQQFQKQLYQHQIVQYHPI